MDAEVNSGFKRDDFKVFSTEQIGLWNYGPKYLIVRILMFFYTHTHTSCFSVEIACLVEPVANKLHPPLYTYTENSKKSYKIC